MSDLPKISVVTPSYRAAHTIEETIESVLNQNYPNLEYIIIDGNGDDTSRVIKKYENHLAYWVSESDRGQYHAIKKGFSKATGEIYCWINADDMLLPKSLFVVGEIFNRFKEVEWISTLQPGTWDASGYLAGTGRTPGFSKQAFLDGLFLPGTQKIGYWIQQESTFFRKSLWEKCSAGFTDCSLAGDFSLWCNFYKHTDLVGVEYPLAGFRHISGQRSEAMNSYLSEARVVLEALRQRENWESGISAALNYSRFRRLPKIGGLLNKSFGYQGRKIHNNNLKSSPAEWEIVDYKFLP